MKAAVLLLLPLLLGCSDAGPREIIVGARGMTFILPSDPDSANPVILLQAGEEVRLVFRNDAPGLIHNFEIPSWNVRTTEIRPGQSTSVVFVVPQAKGRHEYSCRPHAKLMHGFVEVR